jgi:3alpha(or 20beta)-hydroxysteroid dehydrogenase
MRLEGKVALITGGARGMGEAMARLFVKEGARVMISDVLDEPGEAVAADLGDAGRFVHHDVTDEASWAAAIEATVSAFGGLDVLVNNAAIWRQARIEDETPENFRQILDVDVIGVFLGVKAAIAPMRARGGGSIINMSSGAGARGLVNHAAYGSAKWAVRGFTKTAAIEIAADKIRCNSIHPGAVVTPMVTELNFQRGQGNHPVPLGRVGEPEDIAAVALFLASDDSAYMTGSELYVDGGGSAGQMVPWGPRDR